MKAVNTLIENCFAVVELLADNAQSMPIDDIAERLNLRKSGTHRLLAALASIGWVEQDPDTGRYRLSLRLAIMGRRFLIANRLPDLCQPVLDRLAERSHELVRMTMVDGDGLAWIAHAQGTPAGLIYQPEMAAKVPLHVTADGKAWLATLPVEKAVQIVLAEGFGRPDEFGPNAIRSVDALISDLEMTRKRGFGLAREEAEPGVVAIADIIRPGEELIVGTVSLAGPFVRMDEDHVAELVPSVKAAARDISTLWPLRILRQQLAS